jgi:hypothetical protein
VHNLARWGLSKPQLEQHTDDLTPYHVDALVYWHRGAAVSIEGAG